MNAPLPHITRVASFTASLQPIFVSYRNKPQRKAGIDTRSP